MKPYNKTKDKKGEKGNLIRAEVLLKPFINKMGKKSGHSEFYVRRSIQDYFIKFCESAVTRENIEEAIKEKGNYLSLEIEIKQGEWDRSPQSRVGSYIIIHRIL